MPKKPPLPKPLDEENDEVVIPNEDAVSEQDKLFKTLQMGLAEAEHRLEVLSLKALNLTVPASPYQGWELLEPAAQALAKCRQSMADAYGAFRAAEEMWEQDRE